MHLGGDTHWNQSQSQGENINQDQEYRHRSEGHLKQNKPKRQNPHYGQTGEENYSQNYQQGHGFKKQNYNKFDKKSHADNNNNYEDTQYADDGQYKNQSQNQNQSQSQSQNQRKPQRNIQQNTDNSHEYDTQYSNPPPKKHLNIVKAPKHKNPVSVVKNKKSLQADGDGDDDATMTIDDANFIDLTQSSPDNLIREPKGEYELKEEPTASTSIQKNNNSNKPRLKLNAKAKSKQQSSQHLSEAQPLSADKPKLKIDMKIRNFLSYLLLLI